MTAKEIVSAHHKTFEAIRHQDEDGNEYWMGRELGLALDYPHWRNFVHVIDKAQEACDNSGHPSTNHFDEVIKMVGVGSGAKREIQDFKLSRYACYLIVQNADPSKPVIANGQTYFAIQTRRQELSDDQNFARLSEDEKRLMLRREVAQHNKSLVAAAQGAGVETPMDYAVFQDHGYRGLYGGLRAKDIQARKGLKKSQKILDHMGSTELAANLFRATQTEEKLRRENIRDRREANKAHHDVGAKVRKTIQEIGGTMPEDLPTPEQSIQQLEKGRKRLPKPEDA